MIKQSWRFAKRKRLRSPPPNRRSGAPRSAQKSKALFGSVQGGNRSLVDPWPLGRLLLLRERLAPVLHHLAHGSNVGGAHLAAAANHLRALLEPRLALRRVHFGRQVA